jgi:hypothetical protein
LDIRFRHIEVRVSRPKLRALHRWDYYAAPTPELYDRERFLIRSRIKTAAVAEELMHAVDVSLKTALDRDRGRSRLSTSLIIHPTASIYSPQDGNYVGKLAISYFIFNKNGNLANGVWADLDMDLKPQTYLRVLREGFVTQKALKVPSRVKKYLLRVAVYDVANDRVGPAEALVEGSR